MRNKPRRGAMLVLVAIMMVALLSFLAVVVDLSRMYAQKNELQTSADAASTAGVIALLADTTTVVDSALSFGARNQVLKKTISLFPADVQCGIWNDTTGVYTPSGHCGSFENAVAVTTRDSANYVFPLLLGATGKELTRPAIAWAAFVGETNCVKPIAMRWQVLTYTLDPTNPDLLRDLTAYDLQRLNSLPRDSLRFTLKFGSPTDPGNFGALNLTGSQGANDYSNNLGTCSSQFIGVGTVLKTLTGDVIGPTRAGVAQLCQPLTPTPSPNVDGQCQDGNGNMGMLMVVPLWYTPTSCNGSCTVTVKGLVSFLLDSVKFSGAEIIGHFVSVPVGGTVSTTTSTVRRIILVK